LKHLFALFQCRPALIGSALALLLALSGCGGSSAQPPAANNAAPTPDAGNAANNVSSATTPTATAAQPSAPIAAVVNGETISLAVLDRAVERRLAGVRALGDALPADMNAFRLTVLDTLIEQLLIEQAAKIQGVAVTEAQLDAEIQENVNIAGGRDRWLAQLAGDAMTEQEVREGLRSALITQQMRDIVTKGACESVEQTHARHILVADEAAAKQIRDRLRAGEAFATLAAELSLDVSTRQTGGDLGWFARGQLLQPVIEDAAFTLEINAYSDPIRSDLGYHILQVLERVKDRPVDAETCFRLTEAAFERWLQDLVLKSKLEKFPNGR
jgi:parvulin-like peptidyl-prolyl isomerase